MKKIISMGIASAVLALTAIAASADITATGAAEVEAGKTVEVTVTTTAAMEAYGITLAADGLETTLENVKVAFVDTDVTNVLADGSVVLTGAKATGYKAGDVLATITYTVTAAKDADVNIALANMEGMDDVLVNYTAKVVDAAATDPTQPTDPTTDPTDPTQPENPDTGVALAIVPAVIAGAAVVVAKKRK